MSSQNTEIATKKKPLSILDLPHEVREEWIDRLILNTKKSGSCIVVKSSLDKHGYALLTPKGGFRILRAHRAVCEIFHGSLAGLEAMHRCDNPPCVSPVCLIPGTTLENQRDKKQKGRGLNGEKNHKAKLTEGDVKTIIRRRMRGENPRAIAADYDIKDLTVNRIMRGVIWPDVQDVDIPAGKRPCPRLSGTKIAGFPSPPRKKPTRPIYHGPMDE